jgi:hypothetical protein
MCNYLSRQKLVKILKKKMTESVILEWFRKTATIIITIQGPMLRQMAGETALRSIPMAW